LTNPILPPAVLHYLWRTALPSTFKRCYRSEVGNQNFPGLAV